MIYKHIDFALQRSYFSCVKTSLSYKKLLVMKTLSLVAALLMTCFTFAAPLPAGKPADINEKILKAFKESFTNAQEVTWHEYKDVYQASFRQDDVQMRAQYDEQGNLLKTIRYYDGSRLLPAIKTKLNKKYPGREIASVTETTEDSEIGFVINLKDENKWYIVKSDVYGRLELVNKFNRGDK